MINNSLKLIILLTVLLLVQSVDLKQNKALKNSQKSEEISFAQLTADALPEGTWLLLRNTHSNKCLTWRPDRTIKLVDCSQKEIRQYWKVSKSNSGKSISISNINKYFLDNQGGNGLKSSKYGLSYKGESNTQNFIVEKFGNEFSLQNERGRKCLTSILKGKYVRVEQRGCCFKNLTSWTYEKVNFDDSKINLVADKKDLK
jgi:hypothetical protein